MENIKVSIIVPAYNVENYIERTLTSIINQTFKYFELIVVNDGSTDRTLKIIEDTLVNSSVNYKIINQSNGGVSNARNKGIKSAEGDYIFFLDGDDFIREDCIEKLYTALTHNECDAAYTNYIKITNDGEEIHNPQIDLPNTSSPEYLMKLEATMTITFSFCQLMYKRSILIENNLLFNPQMKYGEDTEFALMFLAHTNKIAYAPENLIFYVQRDDSATSSALFKRYDFVTALKGVKEYYGSQNIQEDILKLIDDYRIPKSIWGNTIFLFDSQIPCEEVVEELKRRDLIEELNSFEPITKKDYVFIAKIKSFTLSPKLYYLVRNLIRHRIPDFHLKTQ